MKKHLWLAMALVLATGTGEAQAPTFRTATTLVQLPVRVLDGRGNFVRGLAAADFEVLEDGVHQTVSQFSLIDLPAPSANQAPAPAAFPPGPLSSEALEALGGRIYLFLLDDYHLGVTYSARAKDLVRGFIRERMAANDAAAIMLASGAGRQDFTQDKRLLLATLDRFTGGLDTREPARVQEIKARSVVKLVAEVSAALGQIRGRHKSIIYVGSQVGCRVSFSAFPDAQPGLAQGGGDKFADLSSAGTGAASDAADQILCNEQIWDSVRAAVQANVSVYSIDPRGMQNPGWISPTVDGRGGPGPARERMTLAEPGRPSVLDGFYVFADQTGGFALTGTNNFRDGFDRIVRESSAYYLLGYSSTNDKPDGKYRKTRVDVNRPGVQTFYRTGYVAPR